MSSIKQVMFMMSSKSECLTVTQTRLAAEPVQLVRVEVSPQCLQKL